LLANNGQQEYGRLKESGEIVPPHAIYSWRRCTGAAAASDKKARRMLQHRTAQSIMRAHERVMPPLMINAYSLVP